MVRAIHPAVRITTIAVLALFSACTRRSESAAGTTSAAQPVSSAALPRIATARTERIAAAGALTRRYARSPLSEWKVDVRAAGPDCGILLVGIGVIMEDSMIEAMHYGIGAYDEVYEGGVQRFYREHSFHTVAYRDSSTRVWRFGSASGDQEPAPTPCH